jgi:hypothetical protein
MSARESGDCQKITAVSLAAANGVLWYVSVWYNTLSGVVAKGVQISIWPVTVLQPRSVDIVYCVVAVTNVSMVLSVTIVTMVV